MSYNTIIYTKSDGIATVTMNRPERLNAFNEEMRGELGNVFDEAERDDEVKVLIFTGAGKAFCAGADLRQLSAKVGAAETHPLAARRSKAVMAHRRLVTMSKPTIAAINGAAVGGGLEAALCCDIRIASEEARFGELFVKRGLIADGGGTYLLPRIIGLSKACALLFTGDLFDAQEALRLGVVDQVVPAADVEKAARELAARIAENAPLAVRMTKRLIHKGLTQNYLDHMEEVFSVMDPLLESEDFKEGAAAFLEKRAPRFKGR